MLNPRFLVFFVCFVAFLPYPAEAAQKRTKLALASPVISRAKKTEVRVIIPDAVTKAVLEIRRNGAWETSQVATPKKKNRVLRFLISSRVQPSDIRVMGEEPIEPEYFFAEQSFDLAMGMPMTVRTAMTLSSELSNNLQGSPELRLVAESDIWNLKGDTLYFFNQFRGLQILDVSDPDAPSLKATVKLQGLGEQMYLTADGSHAVLLVRKDNFWSWKAGESEAVVVAVNEAEPKIVARLPLNGRVIESRMVGKVLYVATNTEPNGVFYFRSTSETELAAFDLSNPAEPVAKGTLTFSGYTNAVTATDRFFFVVNSEWFPRYSSTVQMVDISNPNGTMVASGSLRLQGQLQDKFKLSLHGDVLRTISQTRDAGALASSLETFSLSDPLKPTKLGSLSLGNGERLRATRFAGDRAYVVTFLQIDPLWVIDLSDPAKPQITGHLEVPGFSTYIEPVGNKLVTMGRVGSKAAVSLFDVSDPAAPVTLSQLQIGGIYSTSEAEYDEKAFKVLPEKGLILLPLSSYDETGFASGVQLIDLQNDSLTARGQILHTLSPRRANVHRDRVLVVSATDLLSVDISDRDKPALKADLAISWEVNRVLLAGDYLLEIANGQRWNHVAPSVNVCPVGSPDQSLASVELDPGEIIGATVKGTQLHIAQRVELENGLGLRHSILEISALPAISLAGSTVAATDPGWDSLKANWPSAGTIVWETAGRGVRYYPWLMVRPMISEIVPMNTQANQNGNGVETLNLTGTSSQRGTLTLPPGAVLRRDAGLVLNAPQPQSLARTTASTPSQVAACGYISPFWYGGSKELFAFDVTAPQAPKFLSKTDLSATDQATEPRYNFSNGFVVGSKFFFTYQTTWFEEASARTVTRQRVRQPVREFLNPRWLGCHYLQIVDFSTPAAPVLEFPVNVPGKLIGLNEDGTRLFTAGTNPLCVDEQQTFGLHASSFDGRSASILSVLPIEETNQLLMYKHSAIGAMGDGNIKTWNFENGQFAEGTSIDTKSSVASMERLGDLLVASTWMNELSLLDISDPAAPYLIGNHSVLEPVSIRLDSGCADINRGLWLPLGAYGLESIGLEN